VPNSSLSAKNRALREANLPRVLHSEKKCTRGREAFLSAAKPLALGEGWHSGKAFFPECNTRGRGALTKGNSHLTAPLDGTVCQKNKKCLPWVPCSSTRGRWPLPRVPDMKHLGKEPLPRVPFPGTRGSVSSPSVTRKHSGRYFYFLVFFSIFLMPCHVI
jgi:hypothetical protein